MTPSDVVTKALRTSGIVGLGQTPDADTISEGYDLLNEMVAQWARKRWILHSLVDLSKTATGAQTYTVGPGGDFDIALRPDKLEAAYLRQFPTNPVLVNPPIPINPGPSPFIYQATEDGSLTITGGTVSQILYSDADGLAGWVVATSPVAMTELSLVSVTYTVAPTITFTPTTPRYEQGATQNNAVDYPLNILQAREDYSRIALKALTGFSYSVFYDPQYPLGILHPHPVPPSEYQIHLVVKQALLEFTSLAQEIDLPQEYQAALRLSLAQRLRVHFQMPRDEGLDGLVRDAMQVIRGANTAVARLKMPNVLLGRGVYNVYSDRTR